jgi:hypothetical protein
MTYKWLDRNTPGHELHILIVVGRASYGATVQRVAVSTDGPFETTQHLDSLLGQPRYANTPVTGRYSRKKLDEAGRVALEGLPAYLARSTQVRDWFIAAGIDITTPPTQ